MTEVKKSVLLANGIEIPTMGYGTWQVENNSATGDLMKELSAQYGKTPAQICLRWALQHGLVPLVKTANPVRMRENLNVYDFALSTEDMGRIDALPRDEAGAEKPEELVER